MSKEYLPLQRRVVALVIYGLLLYLSWLPLGFGWLPGTDARDMWLVSGISLVLFDLLNVPFFMPASQALATAMASGLLLLSLGSPATPLDSGLLATLRWGGLTVCGVAALAAVFVIYRGDAAHGRPRGDESRSLRLSRLILRSLGSGQLLFTPAALISAGVLPGGGAGVAWVTFVWLVLCGLPPSRTGARVLSALAAGPGHPDPRRLVGTIRRIDSPNLIRVALQQPDSWQAGALFQARLANGRGAVVRALFSDTQQDEVLGTGLVVESESAVDTEVRVGEVWPAESVPMNVAELAASELVGFLVEGSSPDALIVETLPGVEIYVGSVVYTEGSAGRVYWQVIGGTSVEEVLEGNPRGGVRAVVTQIGKLLDSGSFRRFPWLPPMNSPVFLVRESPPAVPAAAGEVVLGHIPGTKIPVRADLNDLIDHHCAILGVTGTGKTEVVFETIRAALEDGFHVVCFDITGDYNARLADLRPMQLGLSEEEVEALDELLFEVEAGAFAAGAEKQALKNWFREKSEGAKVQVDRFLSQADTCLAIMELPQVANTKATLRATELYLSLLFRWARMNRGARKSLLVLEEAHTIVPEFNLFSRDRVETEAVVGRIGQIALQGRKFGVGLLLVSQRTALVSKTVLSQCNTLLCFQLYDRTSLDFLSSVVGDQEVRVIPRLGRLQCLCVGKAIRSERPVVMQVPEDPRKAEMSRLAAQRPGAGGGRVPAGAAGPA